MPLDLGSTVRKSRACAISFLLGASIALFVDGAKAATITIVAIGASNTAGWGVGVQEAFPAIIEARLKGRGYDVQVINTGFPFQSTSLMLARIDNVAPNGTRLVIFDPSPLSDRLNGLSKAQSAANIKAIVSRLRARNIKVMIADLQPIFSRGLTQSDSIHLSVQGHSAAAAMLLPRIMAVIGRRR